MEADPSPDGGGREWIVPVAGILVVVVGVTAVGGGLFLVGTTPSCACSPPRTHAGAAIDAPENGSTVTVTFTSNGDADHLRVRTEAPNGSVTVANTTGEATTDGDGVKLAAVGDAVTFAPAEAEATATGQPATATGIPTTATNTTVEITVVAYPVAGSDASPAVVADETVTLR